jgi:hypothetical protein
LFSTKKKLVYHPLQGVGKEVKNKKKSLPLRRLIILRGDCRYKKRFSTTWWPAEARHYPVMQAGNVRGFISQGEG